MATGTKTKEASEVSSRRIVTHRSLVLESDARQASLVAVLSRPGRNVLTGRRNPYPGKLGVVEQSAFAHLLLVVGISWRTSISSRTPDRNFVAL